MALSRKLVRADVTYIKNKLAGTFKEFPVIAGAYLYGSILEYCRPESDIDVGLILVPGTVKSEREGDFLIVDILEKTPTLEGRYLDLILLNFQTTIFAFQVLSKGELIYNYRPDVVTDFLEITSRQYGEVYPRYRQALDLILGGIGHASRQG